MTIKPSIILISLFILISCVTPWKMLKWAENSWAEGEYAKAIGHALASYTAALDMRTSSEEADAARLFLEEKFPQANDRLSQAASRQLEGTEPEQTAAWETYAILVNMNKSVSDSIASEFLHIQDFEAEFMQAKELAARLLYERAVQRMADDRRTSYIEAVRLLDRVNAMIPNYRDIDILRADCIKSGSITIAFSNRRLNVVDQSNRGINIDSLRTKVYEEIRRYIIAHDHPDFVFFTTAFDSLDAVDKSAAYFVELGGTIHIDSKISDDYFFRGVVTWERSANGSPNLSIVRLSGRHRVISSAAINIRQSVEVIFYPEKHGTRIISSYLFDNNFNDSLWMHSQLTNVEYALKKDNASVRMTIWAEMGFNGSIQFLDTAKISETDERIIDWTVYSATEQFINFRLPEFLRFEDLDLPERFKDIILKQYLSDRAITSTLENL